jgi:hypothetical protein
MVETCNSPPLPSSRFTILFKSARRGKSINIVRPRKQRSEMSSPMFALRRMRFRTESTFERDLLIDREIKIGSDEKENSIWVRLNASTIDVAPRQCVFDVTAEDAVTLRDVGEGGSTYVNNVRMEPGSTRFISEDDVVCFGGPTINPSTLRVNPIMFRVIRYVPESETDASPCAPLTKEQKDALVGDSVCGICLDHYLQPVVLECEHVFCNDCADNWLQAHGSSHSCPVCRHPVSTRPTRVKHLETFITKVIEPSLTKSEKRMRFIRREVLWNKNRVKPSRTTPKVVKCTRMDIMNMLQQCIATTREAALLRNSETPAAPHAVPP